MKNFLLGMILTFMILAHGREANALSTQNFSIPLAETLDPGEVKFDMREQFTLDKTGAGSPNASLWGLSAGIWSWERIKVEGGIDWREPTTASVAAALSAHARAVFNNVRENGWSAGIGVDQLGFHAGKNDYNINHLVFENVLVEDWYMAFGGYAGNHTFLQGDDKGMFAGFWHTIQTGHGRMGLDWTSGKSELGYIVPGISVEIRDGVMGYLAYGLANDRTTLKDWIMMRLSVLF